MIFSRTASKQDLYDLNLYDIILQYLELPKVKEDYSSTLHKFWDYTLLLKLIEYYNIKSLNILNIVLDTEDRSLQIIADYKKLNLTQISMNDFSNMKIRYHRYNIICCFGIMEFIEKEMQFIDKINSHLSMNGYLIITTDANYSYKPRTVTTDDLINISFLLEKMGYDFCSDELDVVNYNDKSNLHSLVMQRLGR